MTFWVRNLYPNISPTTTDPRPAHHTDYVLSGTTGPRAHVVQIIGPRTGSGILIAPDLVLTASHVVRPGLGNQYTNYGDTLHVTRFPAGLRARVGASEMSNYGDTLHISYWPTRLGLSPLDMDLDQHEAFAATADREWRHSVRSVAIAQTKKLGRRTEPTGSLLRGSQYQAGRTLGSEHQRLQTIGQVAVVRFGRAQWSVLNALDAPGSMTSHQS